MTSPPADPDEAEEVDVIDLHARSEREPVKLWPVGVIAVSLLIGVVFLVVNSGGFRTDVYDHDQFSWSFDEGDLNASLDPKALGQRVFSQNCSLCHQPNGEGIPGLYPPLVGSEWVLAQDWHGDNHIVKIVLHGLTGVTSVKGQAYNSEMAPWGPVLSDREIAAVLTYVRNEWGNQAPAIAEEFVASVREQTKGRNKRWTFKELQAIPREISPPLPEPTASPQK